MRVSVPCRLPEDQARARVEKRLTELKERHAGRIGDVRIDWHGNSAGVQFTILKPFPLRIAADLTIKPDEVALEGNLPIIAWPFQAQIEALVGDELRACLE
ncbi:MAG: polyhydroxyalkanoic acid system family protein [Candidatus Brocadiia bacterium]